jgi:hypothetical protein
MKRKAGNMAIKLASNSFWLELNNEQLQEAINRMFDMAMKSDGEIGAACNLQFLLLLEIQAMRAKGLQQTERTAE